MVALAATDSGAGSDLTGLSCEVVMADDHLVVTGTKRWITNAEAADHFLVLGRHRPGRHFTSFTWVLVPRSAPGLRVRPADTDLFRGAGVGHVDLSAVRLPRDQVIGGVGRGLAVFARHIATERLAGALWAVAMCRRTLATTVARLSRKEIGDEPLRQHPVVRQKLGRAVVRVRELHALCRMLGGDVARRHDGAAAAVMKVAAAETAETVLGTCAQLQGADGFAPDGAHQLRAQAGVFGIGGGTTELVTDVVADHLDALLDGSS